MKISDVIQLVILKYKNETADMDDFDIKNKFLTSLEYLTDDDNFNRIFSNHYKYVLSLKNIFPMYDEDTIDYHLTEIYNYKEIREEYKYSSILDSFIYFQENSSTTSTETDNREYINEISREHTTDTDTETETETETDTFTETTSESDSEKNTNPFKFFENLENKLSNISKLSILNLSLVSVSLFTSIINLTIMMNYLKF